MASSQVEIASTSPFGCVLRDRNSRDGCRESNVYQRNIKSFVMDHLNMSMSPDSATNENSNSKNSSWVSKASKNNNLERLRFTRSNHNNNNSNKDNNESCLASLISPRHSRLLDRWAARQAREMVSTLENEAELLAMPNTKNNNSDNMLARTCSNSSSDDASSETSNLGASSLVQMWEKRLNKSNGSKPSTPVSANANLSVEEQNRGGSETEESSSSSSPSFHEPQVNEETFPDWESDKIEQSDQSISPQTRFSSTGTTESDRVSVADIIKRLTATNQGQSPTHSTGDENDHEGWSSSVTCSPCRERECGFAPELSEHRAFLPQVTCAPRIRGRPAFHDLLMQLERDRHGELNNLAERGAVSKFTQRGRIQSLLRLRLLQRGVAANVQSHQKSTASEVNRQPQGSTIMQLREKFSIGVDNRTTVQAEVAEPRSPSREIVNNKVQFDTSPTTNQLSPTTNQLSKDTCSQTFRCTTNHSPASTQKSQSQTSVDNNSKEETHPSSDCTFQETCFEAQHDELQETSEAAPSMTDSNLNGMEDKVETSNQQYTYTMAETSYDETVEEEEETSNQQYAESSYDETVEEKEEKSNQQYAETSYDETVEEEEEESNQHYDESSYDEIVEEVEAFDMNCDETSYDWISEISRPRSYWEERRQAWYSEMLNTESHNEDIRKLLERRTVSSFLSSDFRERMDKLMESHRGTQTHLVNSQDEVEDNQALMTFFQERLQSASRPQEDGSERVEEQEEEEEERRNEEEEEEEEEKVEEQEENLISSSYQEVGDFFNQSSSTHLTTWSYRGNETGDDFDRVASTSSQPSESHSFCQDSRRNSSSTNQHSIEMELIYDLRGHMEQLFHEMSELRKSMKSCMDMHMQLQQSKNQEVQTVRKEEKKSNNRTLKKGNCCICYEMKVDSLLYRCGHMCTCLKCANELQWNSGKCPICRAKIDDVVRVYVDF